MDRLKLGDDESANAIWNRFFHQLSLVASRKLGSLPRRVLDQEDLALSAMNALCVGAREGRFRQFENRGDLWQILVMITSRKAANLHRKQRIRQERGESALNANGDPEPVRLANVIAGPPTEELVDGLAPCCEEMLVLLPEKLRQVALLKLAGHTNPQVAALRGRSVATIERYLQMIRAHWAQFVDHQAE